MPARPAASPPPTSAPAAASPAPVAATVRVHVVGAVRKPGVYSLSRDARVDDAVKLAGGATADADTERINLADFLTDGEQVRMPRKGERPPAPRAPTPRPATSARGAPAGPPATPYRSTARYPRDERPAPAPAPLVAVPAPSVSSATPAPGAGGKVNLNTATAAELDTLPGVGPATAEAILDHRKQHGRFLRIEDVMEVRGIGEKKFETMKNRLTVE